MSHKRCTESVLASRSLFQVIGSGSIPTSVLSPKSLEMECISLSEAQKLNRIWHSVLPKIGTGCCQRNDYLCFAFGHAGVWYAVAIWSNPVARKLPQHTWLELRRLAISPQAPKNTASRMIAVMIRWIKKNRPYVMKLISYHDTSLHTGGIYKATHWVQTIISNGPDWGNTRGRPKSQSTAPKQRWEYDILLKEETK